MPSVAETSENKRQGTAPPFERLDADTDWTIVGSSPLSKTYPNDQAFWKR